MPLYRLILIQLGKSNTGEESSNQGSPEPVRRNEEQEIQGVSSKKAIGALVNLEQEEGAEGEVVSTLIFFDIICCQHSH